MPSPDTHVDVSLWYVLSCGTGDRLAPDPREFRSVRWWTRPAIAAADPAIFDPHLARMLAKFDQAHDIREEYLRPPGRHGRRLRGEA